MKEITVKTQAKYDAVKDQKSLTTIKIVSAPDEPLMIKRFPKNCILVCGDSSQPTIECWDSSQPTIRCGASSQPTIDAWQQSTVVLRGAEKKATAHQQSLVRYIDEEKDKQFESVEAWLTYWELKPVDGKVTLYKAVKPDGTDFRTGKMNYAVGATVECPDWLENYGDECGHGLHCSPHLFLTHKYSKNPHVHRAVEVDVADIRLPKSPMKMPDKIRVKKVQNIRTAKEA